MAIDCEKEPATVLHAKTLIRLARNPVLLHLQCANVHLPSMCIATLTKLYQPKRDTVDLNRIQGVNFPGASYNGHLPIDVLVHYYLTSKVRRYKDEGYIQLPPYQSQVCVRSTSIKYHRAKLTADSAKRHEITSNGKLRS